MENSSHSVFVGKKWKVSELQSAVRHILKPAYGEAEATAMTRLIFYALKGWDLTALVINGDNEASEYLVDKIIGVVDRVLRREPIQYVLGTARFYGMNLTVNSNVLIPRHETEELVDLIVSQNTAPDLSVLDIGTGSGAIAIALSRNLKFSNVTALDVSDKALEVARQNACSLHADITFVCEDVFEYNPAPRSFDIIVSNPPYVADCEKECMEANVLNHEPHIALFVPDDNPLLFYSRIAEIAIDSLKAKGKLYLEINPLFSEPLRSLLYSAGFATVEILKDISKKERFAVASI